MKTIYNTYIDVTSQEQADRLKQMCIDNDLPIWEDEIAFEILDSNEVFGYSDSSRQFFIIDGGNKFFKSKTTKTQFLKLLKDETNKK